MEITRPTGTGTEIIPGLTDAFGRTIDYLRLAVTDRCNLRCSYCMPAEGIPHKAHHHILSFEEMDRLVRIVAAMGVHKVRITGGEPMVRKEISGFIQNLQHIPGIRSVHLTTNAFWSEEQVSELAQMNLESLNISLDTLDPIRFHQITRRDAFQQVWQTIQTILEQGITVKLNTVVQRGVNDDEILPIAELARTRNIEVRFIEEMPFNGAKTKQNTVSAQEIYDILDQHYPQLVENTPSGSTARVFEIPGFSGRVGIIAGYSRSFCASCSRLRITSEGQLKTCLYDGGALDLRHLLRNQSDDSTISLAISEAIQGRSKDGFEAEVKSQLNTKSSMASIGG